MVFDAIAYDPRLKHILDNLDTLASITGIFAGLSITSLYLISETIHLLLLGLALTLASIVYLVGKKRKVTLDVQVMPFEKKILEIFFFVLFTLSILVLIWGEGRPFLYFILLSVSVGFLALAILTLRSNMDAVIQIIKILLISLNLKYSVFSFYGGSGVDYWDHLSMNNVISLVGNINVLPGKELSFPLMHVQVAIHRLLTDLPIKDASNTAIIVPLVVSSICVFLIGKSIFDARIGLLAMLVVNITDYHLYWGLAPQTTTYGACFFYFIILTFVYLTYKVEARWRWMVVALLLCFTLIMTHAASSFILLVTMLGLFVGSFIYREIFEEKVPLLLPIGLIVAYIIFLVQHWFHSIYNQGSQQSVFEVVLSSLDFYVTEHAEFLNRPEAIPTFAATLPPFIERAANTTGLALLVFLSVVGALLWLAKRNQNRFTFPIVICSLTLLIITFIFPLFGIRNIIPTRWFVFIYLFLSLMAASAIIEFQGFFLNLRGRMGIVLLITVCLTFFMITSTISNLDSPLWLKDSTISTSYTFQEVAGADTLTQFSYSISSDPSYWGSVIIDYFGRQASSLNSPDDVSDNNGELFIWRNYMGERPIRSYMNVEGYYQTSESRNIIGWDYYQGLKKWQKVYSNDDIECFIKNIF